MAVVVNLEFRKKLRKMLEDGDAFEDAEIIRYVLEFAWEEYPRPTLIWFLKKIIDWEQF